MKPILLEIEGFNSFEKKQIIDFEKLTSLGLFGIFGKTGSGKTSILDAIIYALYSNIPRGADNIINANAKKMSLRYIFDIKGINAGRYEIQRSVSKSRNDDEMFLARADASRKAKLSKINEDDIQVIADTKREVDRKILDIVGLDYKDFIKTVVLPQGEFSSFLKVTNKDRKEMLERVFSLQKYGDELSEKIKRYKEKYELKKRDYDKELSGYENITKDSIKKLKQDYEDIKREIESLEKTNENMLILQNEVKQLNILEQDYKEKEEKYIQTKKWDSKMSDMREKCKKLSKLGNIQEAIKNYKQLQEEIPNIKQQLEYIKKELFNQEKKLETLQKEKQDLNDEMSKLPDIQKQVQELSTAVKVKENIKKLDESRQNLLKNMNTLEEENAKLNILSEEENIKLNRLKNIINQDEQRIEKNTYENVFKEQIRTINNILKDTNKLDKEIKNIEKDLHESKTDKQKSDKELKNIKDEIEKTQSELDILRSNDKYDEYNMEKYQKNDDIQKQLESIKEKISLNNIQIQNNKNQIEKNEKQLKKLEKELSVKIIYKDELKKHIEEKNRKNIIFKIQETLQEGQECPVCHNVYSHKNHDIYIVDDDGKEELKDVERIILDIKADIAVLISEKANLEDDITKLKNDTDKIRNRMSDQEIEDKISSCKNYKDEYAFYVKQERKRQEIIENKRDKLLKQKASLEIIKNNINIFKQNIKKFEEQLIEKKKISSQNYDEIRNLEKSANISQEEAVSKLKQVQEAEEITEKLNKKVKLDKEEYFKIEQKISEYKKNIENKAKSIIDIKIDMEKNKSSYTVEISKLSDNSILKLDNIAEILEQKQEYISNLKKNTDTVNKNIDDIFSSVQELRLKKVELSTQENIKEKSLKSSMDVLENFRQKENYINFEEIFSLNEEYPELAKKQASIDNYDKELAEIKTLRDLSLSKYKSQKEKLSILQKDKVYDEDGHIQLKKRLDDMRKNYGYTENKLENEKEAFEKKNKILLKNIENEKVLSEVTEIERLFKGKAFVQFLSKYQLSYVCKQASKILENISSGRFELSIDEEGEFIISDFQNGGIRRQPSTLSGGETFLVSLSLALALSSHIQLKGNAPLEFFFMDEGFGTLDNETLDTALECLRRLKNNNLSIGIISHIDKIKEFAPIKLIINQNDIDKSSNVKIVMG